MKGVVYILTSIETGMGYVGSTINLAHRLCLHRNEKYNSCTSKLLGPFEHMILEEFIDEDIADEDEFKFKLELVERKWQDLYWGNIVNKLRARVTQEERIVKDKECKSKYHAENSDKINEKLVCECGKIYTYKHKSRHIKTKNHQEYLTNLPPPPQSIPDTQ